MQSTICAGHFQIDPNSQTDLDLFFGPLAHSVSSAFMKREDKKIRSFISLPRLGSSLYIESSMLKKPKLLLVLKKKFQKIFQLLGPGHLKVNKQK